MSNSSFFSSRVCLCKCSGGSLAVRSVGPLVHRGIRTMPGEVHVQFCTSCRLLVAAGTAVCLSSVSGISPLHMSPHPIPATSQLTPHPLPDSPIPPSPLPHPLPPPPPPQGCLPAGDSENSSGQSKHTESPERTPHPC